MDASFRTFSGFGIVTGIWAKRLWISTLLSGKFGSILDCGNRESRNKVARLESVSRFGGEQPVQLRLDGKKLFVAVALIGASLLVAPSVVATDEVSESSKPADLRAYVRKVDELIKQDPQAKYYGAKGQALEWLGDHEGAVAAFSRKLKLMPGDRVGTFKRADNLRKLGRFQEALLDYNKLMESGERETFIFSGRSICRSRLKDYKGGLADADSAIALDRGSEDGWFAKGCAEYHSRTGDFGVASLSQAIKIHPKCKECWAMRSKAYAAKGESSKSRSDLERAILLGYKSN